MKKNTLEYVLLVVGITVLSYLYFRGLPDVPFHPDEATQIYMSSDTALLVRNPAQLIWSAGQQMDERMRYRLLDAPVSRWMVGLGRAIAGQPPLRVDWNWGRTWSFNQAIGALPSPQLLLVSRLSVAWVFPFSLALIYLIGRKAGGRITAWVALALLASNALILLHTRRAMAESAMLFFTLLTLFFIVHLRRSTWLIAFPLALAFNAKQSSAALALPALAALISTPPGRVYRVKSTLAFGLVFALVSMALNPFTWSEPVAAAQLAWNMRTDFTKTLSNSLESAGYWVATHTIGERLSGVLAQIYIAPLAIGDVNTYTSQTNDAVYLANPMHSFMRSMAGSGVLIGLGLLGFTFACLHLLRGHAQNRRALALLLIATLAQTFGLIGMFEIVFQRYYITLVAFNAIWAGYALQTLAALFGRLKWRSDRRGDSYRESRPL